MSELPALSVVVTTWLPPGLAGGKRFNVMKQARRSWGDYLIYEDDPRLPSASFNYVIGDDGSDPPTLPQIAEIYRAPRCRVTMLPGTRQGVGASLNRCFECAFQISPVALYAVDDWALSNVLDITPWVKLLLQDESIGAVRLGPPHPDLTGRVMHLGELGWALALDRHHYAFSFRPTLFHKRMIDWLGGFEEGVSSLECERLANERWCADPDAPGIVLALPSPFEHLYSVELSALVPEGAKCRDRPA